MHRGVRLIVGFFAVLLTLSSATAADIYPANPLIGRVAPQGQTRAMTEPTPKPTRTPRPTATPKPTRTPKPTATPRPTPVPEQELDLFDPVLYDAPVPSAAYRGRLYILDEVRTLTPSEDWRQSASYGHGGMRIPRLYQYDFRKVICFYYGRPKSVATSGCGATSMSMVIAYLTGDTRQSPYTLFRWAINNELYSGRGLSHEALLEIGANYGVTGEWIGRDKERVLDALKAGTPVIAHMGYGTFTRQGHYIVLRGLTEDGQVLVNDPNSWLNSIMPYNIEEIMRQTKSSHPFLLCVRSDGQPAVKA